MLSKKELKNLAASRHPADQQTLAEYYKERAHRLTTKSEEFAKQAEILAKQPATIESKQGVSCNCPSHFRYFSKLYAQEAAEAQAEAERHERFAQEYSAKKAAQETKLDSCQNSASRFSRRGIWYVEIRSASGPIAQCRA
jgi:hypothetical protein